MHPLEFLAAMADTANRLDLDAHMSLISKDVSVYGVPDFEVITYDDWFNQCQHEFENNCLKKLYEGLTSSLKPQNASCSNPLKPSKAVTVAAIPVASNLSFKKKMMISGG